MDNGNRIAARLRNLQRRDALAENLLGKQGEILERELDEKLETAARSQSEGGLQPSGIRDLFVWDDYQTGSFKNIESIHLRWVGGEASAHRLLEYIPDKDLPFSFTDAKGARITPERFLTDGGTIPSFATVVSGIDRFGYLPAYLLHDWEYVLHHCNRLPPDRDQERVDSAMMEALKTMMVEGRVAESRRNFWRIETALKNFAGSYWNNEEAECSL